MSEFIVYSIPGSPYGRAVMATLLEKGTSCRLVAVGPESLHQQPHLSRHPFGRVPAMEHDGLALYETQAMLRYIDRVLPGIPLTPSGAQAAARMDQVMNVSDWYLFQGVNNVIGFHRIVAPRLLGLAADEAAIAAAMPRAHAVFGELSRLLGSHDFFAGPALSLADMMVGPQLDFLSQTPEWAALTTETPNLLAWLSRMNGRMSFRETTWDNMLRLAQAA